MLLQVGCIMYSMQVKMKMLRRIQVTFLVQCNHNDCCVALWPFAVIMNFWMCGGMVGR